MASAIPPQGDDGSRPSILSLDKSNEPFATQIAKVCETLDIDLGAHLESLQSSVDGRVLPQDDLSDPRTEWALRWLLKKLHSLDPAPGSPHMKPRVWVLLQELAVRTPLAHVARLLNLYEFTGMLRKTLQWLHEPVRWTEVLIDMVDGDGDTSSLLDDSSDTVKSSSAIPSTSKKRKLDGTEIDGSREVPSTAAGSFQVLVCAICGLVTQLESLTTVSEKTHGFAVEHMKRSLRISPDDAACVMGSSFYLINRIIQTPQSYWHQRRVFTRELQNQLANTGYKSCILPVIDLWNRRSLTARNSPGKSSNCLFKTYCLLPTLQLLDSCRARSVVHEAMAQVIKRLEDLLVEHVTQPLRRTFQDSDLATRFPDELCLVSLSDQLVPLLRDFRPQSEDHCLRSEWETDNHLTLTFISLLFDIAIKSCYRVTPKLRMVEDPWLEKLFTQLAKCAETIFPSKSPVKAQKDYVRVVKWMLRKAVVHHVQLSLPTISAVLHQASGLSDLAEDCHVEWGLISLCISSDSNAFVIPSTSTSSNVHYSYRPPNIYLSSLLERITDDTCEIPLKKDEDYEFKLRHVILPLCDAFINARDLVGFMEHWREQLTVVQKRQASQQKSEDLGGSIWEDEELLQFVAHSLESALTVSQIEKEVSIALRDLSSSIPSVISDQSVSLGGALTILDCLCIGVQKDEDLTKLEEKAKSIFDLLGVLLSSTPGRSRRQGWRVWRVMATITDRWLSLHVSMDFKRQAHSAICMAFELIHHVAPETHQDGSLSMEEEIHAFRFMLSYMAMADSFWGDLQFSSRQRTSMTVERVLDLMDPFCHRISKDHFATLMRPDSGPQADELEMRVNPIDRFYHGCVSSLILMPNVLKYIEADLQSRIVGQLYWSAVFQERVSPSPKRWLINYAWPWELIASPITLNENETLMKCLRSFVVERYLSISQFTDPRYWDIGTAEYKVAFQSIQTTLINKLDRGQRSNLANRIFHILLDANVTSLAKTAEHTELLAKLVTLPNRSMDLLTSVHESPSVGPRQAREEAALFSLATRIDGVVRWSADNLRAVDALKRLTHSVMSYLFSSLDQESSVKYLQELFEQIAERLKHRYKEEKKCTTAFSAMFEVSLNFYSHHRAKVPETLKPALTSLDESRQYHLDTILDSIDSSDVPLLTEPERRHSLGVHLECLAAYCDLLIIHPNLQEISQRLFGDGGIARKLREHTRGIGMSEDTTSHKQPCSIEYLTVRLTHVELLLGARDDHLHPSLKDVSRKIIELRSRIEKNRLLGSFKDVLPILGLEGKRELCLAYDVDGQELLGDSELLQIQIALYSLKDEEVDGLRAQTSKLFILVCRGISTSVEFRNCMLSIQCVSILLQRQPRAISQWDMDNLISAISVRASKLEASIKEKHSGMLYIGLCRLFGTILAAHRAKIGGRYHLVVLALQGLLRCLFVPYTNHEPNGEEISAFGVAHTVAYARILTSICDPTVSSVTRSKRRSGLELNDATKKARSIAGQHLPYLMMEYCSCQLKGRLTPEMKTTLNPGLDAVLGILSPEMMRTMNAAMDSSSRSVFKALYEEYRRIGRWDGD